MPTSVLVDNWSLQEAGELLAEGLRGDKAHHLWFSDDGESFGYQEVSADVVRLKALCQLITNIVLVDQLLVDADFVGAWREFESIRRIEDSQVLVPKPLRKAIDDWAEKREAMAEELCVSDSVRQRHNENKQSHEKTGRPIHNFLSQVLWGGAGGLARADFLRVPYVPHPTRAHLFARAQFLEGPVNTNAKLMGFIQGERVKIYRRVDETGFFSSFLLPPVAAEVLAESTDVNDIITRAIALREDYRELRGWMSELRKAFVAEDAAEILSKEKLFQSVSRNVDALISSNPVGDTTMQIGFSFLKITGKIGAPINSIKNRFGVRAQLNKLILMPAGRTALKRLIKHFGEGHSKLGRALERDFLAQSSG
ncbi:MAG TPA: hypothetical protein VJU77_12635 [Chthoniobacterales bacterium]|nr:hypothetical protein [Chthoniobacterales bacterium]